MANSTPKQDEPSPDSKELPVTGRLTKVPEKNDPKKTSTLPTEVGGADGLEPTRYGDWERNGRCTDF